MPRLVILPDGRAVYAPDDMSRAQVLAASGFAAPIAVEDIAPAREDETKSDFIDDMQRSIGSLMSGAGSALRDVNEDAGQWLQGWGNEIVKNNPADYGDLSEIQGLGDLAGFAFERTMEFVPQFAGAVGASVFGSPLAGAAVLAAPTAVSTYGEARESQREQGVYDPLRAGLVAAAAGGLDVLGVGRMLPGKGALVQEVFEQGLKGAAKQGAKTAGEEALTEVGQTALQRYGGYQDLTSPEAIEEYAFSGLAGGILGGGIGAGRAALAPAPEAAPEAAPLASMGITSTAAEAPRAFTPSQAPEEIISAPALSTIEVPDITGGDQPTKLSVLSTPDETGNIWVRTPEGNVTQVSEVVLRQIGGTYTPAVTAEAPAAVPGETPGTFTTTTVINGVPVTTTGLTSQPLAALPISQPIDITEPAPAITPEAPVITPEAPEVAAAAPEVAAPLAPQAPALEMPAAAAPEPTPAAAPEMPEVAPPAAAPIGMQVPVAEPAPAPEAAPAPEVAPAPKVAPTPAAAPAPAPEQYVFTREKAEEVGSHDPQLAQALIGKTVSGGAEVLAQRTKAEPYRMLANRIAGVARAMEGAGIRMPIGITAIPGGQGQVDISTLKSASAPYTGGVTRSFRAPSGVGFEAVEVAMRGKPTKTVKGGANERTLLHELLHSVTTGAQRMSDQFAPDSRVGQALKDIKALHDKVRQGVADIQSGKLKVDIEAKAALARLQGSNAFLNERELLAWGMTDYDMQTVLKAIPTKGGNAFTDFVRLIGRMLGVGPKDMNALRELIELTEVVVPTDAKAQQEIVDVVSGKAAAKKVETEPQVEAEVDEEAVARWSEKRLSDYLRTYAYLDDGKRTKALAVSMKPDEFLNLTTMDDKHKAKIIEEAGDLDLKKLRDEPTAIVLFVSGDKDDLQVIGHEGRHRMAALKAAGIDEAPVVLKFESGKERTPMDGVTLSPEDFGGGRAGRTIEFAFNAIPISYDYADQLRGMMTKYGGKVEVDYEQTAPSPIEDEAGRPVIQYSLGDETRSDRWRRLWVDKMRRLGFVEEAIQKSLGRPLSRAERTSEKAALFEGRADTRLNELQRDHIDKIIEILKKEGIAPHEADMFLLARTAPDRNAKIAKRNPDMPDGGSGMTNDVARQVMLDITLRGDMPKMLRMAEAVDAMTKATRNRMVEYGLLSKKQADALEREEPFYVPLKGNSVDGDLTTAGDETFSAPGSGRGFSVTRKEYLAAKGRMSLPFSPLATAMNDAQDTIVRGERNRVGQSFLNDIAKKYDSNAWQVFTDEKPDMTVQYVQKDNKVRAVPVNMAANAKQYFVVKENGKPYYIKINDPILMRALTNGSTEDFSAVNKFLGNTIGKVTRAISQLHTTLNPEFVVPNIMRDIEAAVFNLAAEQDAVDGRLAGQKIIKGVLKDIKSWDNLKRLYKATFNHTATTEEQKQTSALFQQAKEDGAFTGWILYSTPEEQMAKVKAALDRSTATGKKKLWYSTLDGTKRVIERIQDLNSVAENVTRFSVYKNALEAFTSSGMPEAQARDQAANMARNVTVDFNRKGEAGPTANAIYAFFNASVQGNVQLLRSLFTAKTADGKRTRAQKMAMGMVGLGALMAMVGRGMSEEDKDGMLFYDKIPDWEKERNMVLMLPDGKEYIKIPMPYGYSLFHNIGAMVADMSYGNKTPADAAVGLFSGLVNNFSPVPISGQSIKGVAASLVPTAMRPFADLAINENFFGSPIYNEPFDENQAQSSVSRFSTPEAYKTIVEFLNEATGGKGRVAGAVDLPAESLEYLMNYYVGGAGKFLGKMMDWGKKLGTGEEITARDVPLFNKVLGEPNNQNDLGLYYDRLNEISPIERQLRNSSGVDRRDLMEKFPVETNPRVVAAMKQAKQQLKEANKIKRNLLERDMDDEVRQERLDKLNERIHNIYLRFNGTYNQVKEREG